MKDLIKKIEQWADKKDLLNIGNAEKQFMKFIEEMFEFKTEMDNYDFNNGNNKCLFYKNMEVEMGDIFVTLIILCKQLDIDPIECLSKAYNKIESRKGKTINGIFYKQEDLENARV